ncbi:MAG TPA: T9SS type A sorting domain-containing protein [Ferruginibacter sp.]|nr:T9SS type A sorting domain-containing protein [Ferruginibacter sp.]HMP20783.1 T9SS type A sorting domain-containing protein [Ferruginibacter sp.]
MHKILLVFIFSFVQSISIAQCPAVNIFTRPDSAFNPQRPLMINNFNWLHQKYKLNTIAATPGNDSIWSPIYQPDNSIIDHLRLSLDMKPQDGWELLRREMGYNQDGTPANPKPENSYIVMYNKYSSILRFFYARSSSAPFTAARITLKFADGSPAQSSLLDLSEGLIPLDSLFQKNKIFQSPSEFDNRLHQWFYADFPMQYDPCTCYYTSRLNIEVKLISQANVDISGTANGKLMAINNNAGPVNQSDKTFSFSDILSAAKKASKTFKDINKFKADQEKAIDTMLKNNSSAANSIKQNLNLMQSALKGSGFLKGGLASAPYIGAAVSLLDFFIGGGKKTEPAGPQEVKLTPTSIDMTIKLNGTITSTYNYGGAIFWNPGSNISGYGNEDYPYYNEIMGIFNLIETPLVKMKRTTVRQGSPRDQMYTETSLDYRIQNPIKYVLNPAARLTIQDAQVALIVEGDSAGLYGPAGDIWQLEGKDSKTNYWQYRSPYVDVKCLNKHIFEIRASDQNGHIDWQPQGKYYLKFIINFKRLLDTASSQNVLFVAKYPVKMQTVANIGTINYNDPCTDNLFLHATNSEVNTFCNSMTYKTNRVLRIRNNDTGSQSDNVLERTVIRSSVFPNPTSSFSSLILETKQPIRLNIYIVDALGRKAKGISKNKNYPTGMVNERLDFDGLPNGVYFVVVENLYNKILKKVILQR